MEEIPHGEKVRVKMAVKRLERKNFKPLSANLNKILCKPLKTKTHIFPPPSQEITKNSMKRSSSNTHLGNDKKPLIHPRSEKKIDSVINSLQIEVSSPFISPGLDKKKTFNEMKAFLSPALRKSFPKLNKPDLNILNEKLNFDEEHVMIKDENQFFISQGIEANYSLKNLLKPALKEQKHFEYFFPDGFSDDDEKKNGKNEKNRSNSNKKDNSRSFQNLNLVKTDRKLSLREKNFEKRENVVEKADFSNSQEQIPQKFRINNNKSAKNQQKKKEVSKNIAQNLKKLNTLPLITYKQLQNSKEPSENNSFSIDLNTGTSVRKPLLNASASFSILDKNKNDTDNNKISTMSKRKTFNFGKTTILSVRYDYEDEYLAVGCEDSIIRIINNQENYKLQYFLIDNNNLDIATTCIRWRPKSVEKILLATQATGVITLWDVCGTKIKSTIDEDNYVYSSDFNSEGLVYATGGSDTTIRIYDLEYKTPISFLKSKEDNPGHSNRIYNLLFNPHDPNILFSGGWDCNIFLWDLRIAESIYYIAGPMICGDSMDYKPHELLTGSWRNDRQIEIWDIRTFKLLKNIEWIPENPGDKSFIYSCKYSKCSPNLIIAGTTGKCELRLFDKRNDYKNSSLDKYHDYGIFSLDFSNSKNKDEFICGTGEGKIGLYHIK